MRKAKAIFWLAAWLVVSLMPIHASATGIGWYVWSFNWENYELDLQEINASVEACRKSRPEYPVWCGEEELVGRFVGFFDADATRIKEYEIADGRPESIEIFEVESFKEASSIARSKILKKYFLYFKTGRSEWKDQYSGCDGVEGKPWGCTNAYILLRPSEVVEFEREIKAFISIKPESDFPFFKEDMEGLLSALENAHKGNRALFFFAMD